MEVSTLKVALTISSVLIIVSLPCVLASPVRIARQTQEYVTVSTSAGQVKGHQHVIDNVTLGTFLGIPYAQPPIGPLRFAKPRAHTGWPGILDALSPKARCPHRILPSDPTLPGVPETEDCLYLDVYAPIVPPDGSSLPTMLFVHGGGFYGGSGSLYDFTNLALKGVVVVTVNFRLDAFGFLSTEDEASPGNFGVLDCVMALNWVKENIRHFGGNPDDITLFGGSSGAAMVSAMTLSPLTRGTFQKAIMQSGVSLAPWAVNQRGNNFIKPRRLAEELGSKLNCSFDLSPSWHSNNHSHQLLACLREVDEKTLLAASINMQEVDYAAYTGGMIWTMVVDHHMGVLPESTLDLLAERKTLRHVPTIYGFTSQDGSWLVPGWTPDSVSLKVFKASVYNLVRAWFEPELIDDMFGRIMEEYLPQETELDKTPFQLRDILVEVMTDASMAAFIIHEARMFSRSKDPMHPQSYVYEFAYNPSFYASIMPEWYGIGHAYEKGFVLGLPHDNIGFTYPSTTAADQKVAQNVLTLWSNFAKFGNPTPMPVDGVIWPQFRGQEGTERMLLIEEDLKVGRFNRQSRVKVWTQPFVDDIANNALPFLSSPGLLCILIAVSVMSWFKL